MTPLVYKTDRKPLIDLEFARGPGGWPKADSGKVSIFEAICIVGRSKFGDEWRGSELQALQWPEQPRAAYDRLNEKLRQPAPINSGGGGAPKRFQTPATTIDWNKFQLSPDAHVWAYKLHQAVEKEQAAWIANEEACVRLFGAIDWLAQRCRDGDLTAYARPSEIGALSAMSPWEWNVEMPLKKYVSQGRFTRYFGEVKQTWQAYAFFDRLQLEQATATFQHAKTSISVFDLGRLSPYLQLAVKLALSKGYISPETDESMAIREAEVKAAWEHAMPQIPRSDTAIKSIAKVLGFPDAKAIEQGKSKKRLTP